MYRYALNTSTIRDCGELTLPEKFDVTAKAGYVGIEPWVRELDAHVEGGGTLAEIRKLAADLKLDIVNLIGFFAWGSNDEAKRGEAFAEAERCFAMAAELGCTYVAAPPMGIHQETDFDLTALADRYAALLDLGEKHDVVPILEFWGMAKTLGRLSEALYVAAQAARPKACILADIYHMYKGAGQFEALRLTGPDTIKILHVNDYPAKPVRADIADADRVYPGDGIAPYGPIMQILKQTGFTGYMSLELFNAEYWKQDALTVAKTGLAKLKAAVEG